MESEFAGHHYENSAALSKAHTGSRSIKFSIRKSSQKYRRAWRRQDQCAYLIDGLAHFSIEHALGS